MSGHGEAKNPKWQNDFWLILRKPPSKNIVWPPFLVYSIEALAWFLKVFEANLATLDHAIY